MLQQELLDPLGMARQRRRAEAIDAAANHAQGYRWTPEGRRGAVHPAFPYVFDGAGDINSTVEDMARWVRLQLGNGTFEGKRSSRRENLAYTRTPKVAINDKRPMRWAGSCTQTPNGSIVWHNGGTNSFGAFIGLLLDNAVGVIVLTNQQNVGLPDAIGLWALDRLLDNPASTTRPTS